MRFYLGDSSWPVDLGVLVDTRLLVQANSGGGKSRTLRRILEQTHGHLQHFIIDPEGEFASLREKYDYVLAARGGDTSVEPRAARLLAERLLELGVSAILDIYELKAHDRVRFVREFLEALVDAPKGLWHPALVVVDESHVYCPQTGEAESAQAVKDLATRGRKRGFCAVLATQRLSKLHKDAAAECNNKLIGRTGLDVDLKRAADELGMSKEDARALRTLEPGDFFAYGPAMSNLVQKIHVGPVVTKHPQSGARLNPVVPPPTQKVKALLPKLADLPAEAETKKKTEDDLRRENADLRRQLAAGPKAEPARAAPPKVVEVPAVSAELDRKYSALMVGMGKDVKALKELGQELDALGRDFIAALDRVARSKGGRQAAPAAHRQSPPPAAMERRPATVVERNGEVTGPEQKILDAVAWLNSIGVERPSNAAVSFVAGYSVNGGGYCNPRGALRTRGLLRYEGDALVLTDEGRGLASEPDPALDGEELRRRILARLPGPEARILGVLIRSYPEPMTNEQVAAACDPPYDHEGGGYCNPRGRLRTLQLIEYRSGQVVAADILFPGGL